VERRPVIIEAAINGTRSTRDNPNVPKAPGEIAADALACFEAGAAIVHNHLEGFGGADDDVAEAYLAGWRPVLDARPDALLYPTVNIGAAGVTYGHLRPLAASGLLRLGLCDPGSVNLGPSIEGVPAGGFVYANSFALVADTLAMHGELGLGPNMAIYEPGWLRLALAHWRAGTLPRGAMFKLYLSTDAGLTGSPFGLPPTVTALEAYLELLDGCPIPWAVSVVGGDVVASPVAEAALRAGGHLHLGLEFFGGDRTPTNAELVAEAVALCESLHLRPATPTEAAALLDLPAR
jgi:3-keto-5-aminohexanoate cleavage enzyme